MKSKSDINVGLSKYTHVSGLPAAKGKKSTVVKQVIRSSPKAKGVGNQKTAKTIKRSSDQPSVEENLPKSANLTDFQEFYLLTANLEKESLTTEEKDILRDKQKELRNELARDVVSFAADEGFLFEPFDAQLEILKRLDSEDRQKLGEMILYYGDHLALYLVLGPDSGDIMAFRKKMSNEQASIAFKQMPAAAQLVIQELLNIKGKAKEFLDGESSKASHIDAKGLLEQLVQQRALDALPSLNDELFSSGKTTLEKINFIESLNPSQKKALSLFISQLTDINSISSGDKYLNAYLRELPKVAGYEISIIEKYKEAAIDPVIAQELKSLTIEDIRGLSKGSSFIVEYLSSKQELLNYELGIMDRLNNLSLREWINLKLKLWEDPSAIRELSKGSQFLESEFDKIIKESINLKSFLNENRSDLVFLMAALAEHKEHAVSALGSNNFETIFVLRKILDIVRKEPKQEHQLEEEGESFGSKTAKALRKISEYIQVDHGNDLILETLEKISYSAPLPELNKNKLTNQIEKDVLSATKPLPSAPPNTPEQLNSPQVKSDNSADINFDELDDLLNGL